HWASIVAVGLGVGVGIGVGCAAGGSEGPETTGGGGGAGQGGEGTTTGTGGAGPGGAGPGVTSSGSGGGGGGGGSGPACAKFSAEAKQLPAAMLFVLDMSASMKKAQKWGAAQLAVVSAIDKDVFDSMSLGLVTFPSSFTDPPQCLCDAIEQAGLPCSFALPNGVTCGYSALPQVAMAPAGKEKSNDNAGVRKKIYDYLVANNPVSSDDDGSPVYDALAAAYSALKAYNIEQRMAVLITDGGFSCTSLSNRPGYQDPNGCPDWEIPDSVNQLISTARTDAAKPITTFVVGVPGANSTGAKVDGFDTPPYNMRLALSTYAVSGAPDSVDPACDKGVMYMQNGAEPAVPCHFDLSGGAAFDADVLAKTIADIRGKALGCVYDLPDPPPGEVIDPTLVNVIVTLNGAATTIPKRSKPDDTCAAEACWDYNAKGQVEIIGKGCSDISGAADAKVEIQVGCSTILK
ncbi:MAG TPA: hypothetical protein VK459_11675, partial [Polyangiaceae bacterium]|nr:hypothetical protein [Polyangiaceae bacterium]